MHRRGIDGYDKPRLSDECRQRKQIRLAGKIDDCARKSAFDFSDMLQLRLRSSARNYDIGPRSSSCVLDCFSPPLCVPEFFRPRRTRMKNNERVVDLE